MLAIYSSDRRATERVGTVNNKKYEILTKFVDSCCVFKYIKHGLVELPI